MEGKENLYALWLEGKLSEEERLAFEKSDDFKVLNSIVGEVDSWSLPPLQKTSPTAPNTKSEKPKGRNRFFIFSFVMLAAIGLSYFVATYDNTDSKITTVKTELGQTNKVLLPDSTSVTLIGATVVEFDKEKFKEKPVVKIQGVAYVEKKNSSKLQIQIGDGKIELTSPTKVQVVSKNLYTDVAVYEGQVEMTSKTCGTITITKEQGFRKSEGTNCDNYKLPPMGQPAWLVKDYVEFNDTPLWQVCVSLEAKYGVEIQLKGKSRKMKFTGRYPNNNKDLAFKIVFETMGLNYHYKDDVLVVKRK